MYIILYIYIFFLLVCAMPYVFKVFKLIDHHYLFSKCSSFFPVGYHFDLLQHEFDASVFSRFENMNHHGKRHMCKWV